MTPAATRASSLAGQKERTWENGSMLSAPTQRLLIRFAASLVLGSTRMGSDDPIFQITRSPAQRITRSQGSLSSVSSVVRF